MKYRFLSSVFLLPFSAMLFFQCGTGGDTHLVVNQWEKVTLTFEGPELSEQGPDNPFLNYRLMVQFSLGDYKMNIPGFFAADGHAGESGAEKGRIWKVHFRPSQAGNWSYSTSFRKGERVAISEDANSGEPTAFDGEKGMLEVLPADHRGRLITTNQRYLKYAGNNAFFLKGGADSPENFLAYHEFDGTHKGESPQARDGEATGQPELHKYEPHIGDWNAGDPVWHGDKGKGIIGALNYLAGKGMNSVYFLTMNIGGDGRDVWPYTGYAERQRFDCSKLDQWEIVFDHMDKLGLMLHVVTQETENEKLLDDGNTTFERKLYYRELIARFSHHLAVTWNMGEENGPAGFSPNGQNTEQRKAMVQYFKDHDPYQNFVVIHTHSNLDLIDELFDPMLGFTPLDGMSLQIGNPDNIHSATKNWIVKSQKSGHPWVINLDELGPANRGIDPDDREDNNQDSMRNKVLWANLMAGGGGVEWYFGYLNHNNDLGCEDWRSRDRLWDYTRFALEFFQENLPFTQMESRDDLIEYLHTAYCYTLEHELYAIYLSQGGPCKLDLRDTMHSFAVEWYNPRTGGPLVKGTVEQLTPGSLVDIGLPPETDNKDWVALIKRI
ncbi:MAG: DUF5060 domain-containing protein [Saprospiraceae bacterium]|nr:DUF5060 domain-containing protein [Saprospiraceae bacterium]